jgi:hypothetical protein
MGAHAGNTGSLVGGAHPPRISQSDMTPVVHKPKESG